LQAGIQGFLKALDAGLKISGMTDKNDICEYYFETVNITPLGVRLETAGAKLAAVRGLSPDGYVTDFAQWPKQTLNI